MQALHVALATPVKLLVLIGGGEFSFGETREIDEFLVRNMPSDRRTIAFLPTASGSAEYALHLGNYFRQMDPTLETINVPIYRGRDNRRQKNLNAILSAGLIYLGGGVTNNLLTTIRESPVDSGGSYRICGLPTPFVGKLQVFRNGVSSGQVDVRIDHGALGLRSLTVAATQVSAAAADTGGRRR